MIGILQDPDFERFEAHLDWLETTGVLVEQFDPSTTHAEVARRPAVQQILSAGGDCCLPLTLVNESIVSRGADDLSARLPSCLERTWSRDEARQWCNNHRPNPGSALS
jgi:hypothetical protein